MEYLVPVVVAMFAVAALVGVLVWRATRTGATPPASGDPARRDGPGARSEASRTDSERLGDRP